MEHFLDIKESNIHFHFDKPLIENIKDIYFKYELNNNLLNKSFVNYYDEKKINNKKYIFRGCYKEEYFIILIDSIDLSLNNIIYHKNVIIIKLKWELIKIQDDLCVNIIFIKNNQKYEYLISPFRNLLNKNNDIPIEDLIQSNKKEIGSLIINKKDLNKLFNIKSILTF